MFRAYGNYWIGYADFRGRTDVRGYWLAVLANFIISMAIAFVYGFIVGLQGFGNPVTASYAFSLLCLLPSFAIIVRRLRDAGEKWTNIFWLLLPIAGAVVLIIKLCKPTAAERAAAQPAAVPPVTPAPVRAAQPSAPAQRPSAGGAVYGRSAVYKKLPLASLREYTGNGVCDVCNDSLSGRKAYIVPNDAFYRSPEYREHFKRVNSMFGITGAMAEQQLTHMQLTDTSPGSAVCEKCIHMFAE